MNESRVFMLNGTEIQNIVTRLEGFFRSEKGMEVQSSQTTEGYVMQASQPKDGWKTLTGMRLAITVQMSVTGNQLNVSVGEGQWSDKIGAGAVGLFMMSLQPYAAFFTFVFLAIKSLMLIRWR
mgnify:CR=1 FL=1